jgi:hypothetical protein
MSARSLAAAVVRAAGERSSSAESAEVKASALASGRRLSVRRVASDADPRACAATEFGIVIRSYSRFEGGEVVSGEAGGRSVRRQVS